VNVKATDAAAAICVSAISIVLAIRYEQWYLRLLVRRAHDRPGRGAVWAFLVQALGAAMDVCMGVVAHATGDVVPAFITSSWSPSGHRDVASRALRWLSRHV
jgi:hypothetical protein